jgi:hypothetical protein
MQRSTSFVVSDIEVSSAIDQYSHYRPMPLDTDPMERSPSLSVSDIEVSSAIDQHRHYGLMTQ